MLAKRLVKTENGLIMEIQKDSFTTIRRPPTEDELKEFSGAPDEVVMEGRSIDATPPEADTLRGPLAEPKAEKPKLSRPKASLRVDD